jgi:hypothetical protein
MGHHLIARCPIRDHAPQRSNHTGGLNPERHWRAAANIPVASPNELIPIAHARRPDLNQHLVRSERTRPGHIDNFNIATGAANTRYKHLVPPNGLRRLFTS